MISSGAICPPPGTTARPISRGPTATWNGIAGFPIPCARPFAGVWAAAGSCHRRRPITCGCESEPASSSIELPAIGHAVAADESHALADFRRRILPVILVLDGDIADEALGLEFG